MRLETCTDAAELRGFVKASMKQEQIDQLPKHLLEWDDEDPLGPMELTGAYYVRGHSEGVEEGRAKGVEEGLEKGRAKGVEEGLEKGRALGAIEGICEVLDISLGPSERAQMEALDTAGLGALFTELKLHRRWPTPASTPTPSP